MVAKRMSVLVALVMVMGLWACGQRIQDTRVPIDTSVGSNGPSLVLLPLADYSTGPGPDDALHRQVRVSQAISYYLAKYGFYLPVEEDVVRALSDLGVIELYGTRDVRKNDPNRNLYSELQNGWCDEIIEEVNKVINQNNQILAGQKGPSTELVGLTPEVLKAISRQFGSDFVIRGRILEYQIRPDGVMCPVHKGLVPFFFDFGTNTLLGIAEADKYDLWGDVAAGAAIGAWAAESSNAFTGALAGAGAGYLVSKGGDVPAAVVQVALALQDPETGRVLWANWVEKKVAPKSVWSDTSVRVQMDRAVDEAARDLVEDLVRTLKSGRLPVRTVAKADITDSLPAPSEPEEELVTPPTIEEPVSQETESPSAEPMGS